jgi:hypothetical protein
MLTITKHIIITAFLLTFSVGLSGQHFIGLHKSEISAALKEMNPQFKLDKNAVNHTYKYLKYVDKITEQTILFFLSENDTCTYVRWMADYSNLGDMTGMLNKNFRKSGANTWTYNVKGIGYTITLEEEEWYFTISFRKD